MKDKAYFGFFDAITFCGFIQLKYFKFRCLLKINYYQYYQNSMRIMTFKSIYEFYKYL